MKVKGVFNSVWDANAAGRGYVISTDCEIDLETGEVLPEAASDGESESVEILDREYVTICGKEFPVESRTHDIEIVDIEEFRNCVAESVASSGMMASS